MSWEKYNQIDTLDKLKALDAFLMEDTKPRFNLLAVDTETNGLGYYKDVVIGVSLAVDRNKGFYIPLLTWEPDTTTQQTKKIKKIETSFFAEGAFRSIWDDKTFKENVTQEEYEVPAFIKEYLEKWLLNSDCPLVMHNAPFDALMIANHVGIDLSHNILCDTALLKRIIDENTASSLKATAILYSKELGIDAGSLANSEQLELGESILRNGGAFGVKQKTIWRGDLSIMTKYASADAYLTYGVFEVLMDKFSKEYSDKHFKWFFEDEVMPVCREVVIPMKNKGVQINLEYFKTMLKQTEKKLDELEDRVIASFEEKGLLEGFDLGKSVDEQVSEGRIVKKLIEMEGLSIPTKMVKGELKQTLTKAAVKKEYEENPHWVWGYILGYNALKLTKDELLNVKRKLYEEVNGKRHRFSLRSPIHLRWLLKKMGYDLAKLPQTKTATKDNVICQTGAEVWETFVKPDYGDLIKPFLLYKKLFKQYTSYILPAVTLSYKGRLYMDMNQGGTVSGRFACSGGFNLQTLPAEEELDKCPSCGSRNIDITKEILLLSEIHCKDCKHVEREIFSPSAIKDGFIAPPNMKIVNADYASLEPRAFAFQSGDDKIKDVYRKNLDLYSKIYIDMMKAEKEYSADPKAPNYLKKVAPEKRKQFKPVVLSIPYGSLAPQVARLLDLKTTIKYKDKATKQIVEKEVLDVNLGTEYRNLYLNTYPELHAYMIRQENKALTEGQVETLVGRRRHFKFATKVFKLLQKAGYSYEEFLNVPAKELKASDLKDGVFTKEALYKLAEECDFKIYDPQTKTYRNWGFVRSMFKNELNNAKNFPIQGIAAHIANRAMLEVTRAFKEAGLRSWVFLQVHDEISVYAYEDELEETLALLKVCMEQNEYAMLLDVPMSADPVITDTLKGAK